MVQKLRDLLLQAKAKLWESEPTLKVTVIFPDTAQGRAARAQLISFLEKKQPKQKTPPRSNLHIRHSHR